MIIKLQQIPREMKTCIKIVKTSKFLIQLIDLKNSNSGFEL